MSEGHESVDNAARRLERVGELMRQATPPESLQQSLEGRARLIASVEKMRRRSPVRPVAMAFVFAAAVAAAALLVVRHRAPASFAWHVENGQVGEQGYVSIAPTAPSARLVFDDGSDVTLSPGLRGRVAATTPVGAEVVLEQGRARVHVQHRDKTQWTVDAGPFAVRVTGTEFILAWAADAGTLDVWMQSGRVVVTGPGIGESVAITRGQHMAARLHEATVQIDSAPVPAEPGANAVPVPGTEPTLQVPSVEVSAPPMPSTAVAAGPSWAKLVSAGDYARVVREAEAEGVGHALATRPLSNLRALGDAGRYTGSSDRAPCVRRRPLSLPRQRRRAHGRVPAGARGRGADYSLTDALRWYDCYLAEAPGGAFAGDALGRKMVLVSKAQGRDSARPLAERYLSRFPDGPYAAAARDLAP